MGYVIGLDVGSSSLKAGVFQLDGSIACFASRDYPTHEPQPGFKEQDPERWWTAAVDAIREITRGIPSEAILALGATGHISSFTFVNADGQPLRPAVSFQDQRAVAELDELYQRFSREELAIQLGIDLPPAATWPLPRLLWFRKHEPGTLSNAKHLLQAKDFVNLRLTGAFAGDHSSNRGMVDLDSGCAAQSVFDALELDSRLLPPLQGPSEIVGTVTPRVAAMIGLRAGLPVACGWNDLNACVLGTGAVEAGNHFNITGTSEHIGVVTGKEYRHPSLISAPFLAGKRLLYGVTLCGGGSLEWYRRASGRPIGLLLALAEAAPAGSDSLLFLPYLEGERAPIWDARASGAFVGLRTSHGEMHLARAVLEGVAFSLRQILELVEAQNQDAAGAVTVTGGGSLAKVWNQIKADVLGRRIVVMRNPQAGVLGAAMLAAVAAGCYSNPEEAARKMTQRGDEFSPSSEMTQRYDSLFQVYKDLYPALRPAFIRLHGERNRLSVSSASKERHV